MQFLFYVVIILLIAYYMALKSLREDIVKSKEAHDKSLAKKQKGTIIINGHHTRHYSSSDSVSSSD
jgi:preprotein translocase subunit YajC